MVATRSRAKQLKEQEARDVDIAIERSNETFAQQTQRTVASKNSITPYLRHSKTDSRQNKLAFSPKKPAPPGKNASQKQKSIAAARKTRVKHPIAGPDSEGDDESWIPAVSVAKQATQVATRRSTRPAAKETSSKLKKIFEGRVEKSSKKETKHVSRKYKKTVVVKQDAESGQVEKTTTTRTVSETTTKTVKRIIAVKPSPRRQKKQHLKLVLRGIDFSKLSQAIQDQDWKVLRQQKRLQDYKGRYLPPALNQCRNRYGFKFEHDPFAHAGFKAPSVGAMWEVYRAVEKDLKENFGIVCFLDQPDQATNELQDGPAHLTNDLTVDNLIKVILSISTENSLAIRQHAQLCSKFTYTMPDGSERTGTIPNYHKMRVCSAEELIGALSVAGHHNIRQKAFHGILSEIYDQNLRRIQLGEIEHEGNPFGAPDFVPGLLSMDYLKQGNLGKQEQFDLLVNFPQIAVKTGCCLLAFNLKIPVFVVDTHAHNMVRDLGWIPDYCTDADKACMFLDNAMPVELKFGLHQGLWHHRINCVRCMPRANPKSQAYKERVCPLDHLMNRDLRPLRKALKDEGQTSEEDGVVSKSKKERSRAPATKKLKATIAFLNIHHKLAKEAGYVLRKVVIDDDFGDGSRQNKEKSLGYHWGLKANAHADDIVKLKEAVAAAGLSMEEYEARFVKKARARRAKAATQNTELTDESQPSDPDGETLEELLADLEADEEPETEVDAQDDVETADVE